MRGIRRLNRRALAAWLIAAGLLAGGLAAVAQLSWGWAEDRVAQGELLPGTTIGGVDVSGLRATQAVARLERELGGQPDRSVRVVHGDRVWAVEAAELGATRRLREAVRTALARSDEVAWPRLAWAHWLDGRSGVVTHVPLEAAETEITAFVARVAEDVDRPARDAGATWTADHARLVEHRRGRRLDRRALRRDVARALRRGGGPVEAEVATIAPEVTTEEIVPLLPAVETSVRAALDRRVTVTADGRSWRVAPGDVGATPDMAATVAAHREAAASHAGAGAIVGSAGLARLDIPQPQLAAKVRQLVGEVEVAVRDAELDASSGWIEIQASRAGHTVDRDVASRRLEAALHGERDATVSLPVERVTPQVTTAAYDDVLLLRQNERHLYHYEDGEIAAQWRVAVGAGGSPTPTGRFTVGFKRHRPTWHNPDPDGWGADMPDVIEPGPTNPLGLRALNWYDDGRDTLIRFHGTANEGSIGRAASQGCVRLSNRDVIELYQRVPTGTPIVSVTA